MPFARPYQACDPAYLVGDEPCVADGAQRTECVDFLREHVCPCRVSVGEERLRCSSQRILGS